MRLEPFNLSYFGIDETLCYIFRDDLFPYYYGGNKARKIRYILKDLEVNNFNAVVTTGGIQSNHCRVVALLCAERRIPCTLVLHGDSEAFFKQSGNAKLMRDSNATLQFVEPSAIGSVMDDAMRIYRGQGLNPMYIHGGGHMSSGIMAYKDAFIDFASQMRMENLVINDIFLASGTGSCQMGLVIGAKSENLNTTVHGISVARDRNTGIEKMLQPMNNLGALLDREDILFYDEYRFGGYGLSTEKLAKFSDNVLRETGVVVDSVYTAKALYAMIDIIKMKQINTKCLFWHTGGLLNFMQ